MSPIGTTGSGLIIGVGVACLDYIWQVPAYPAADSKTKAAAVLVQGGGPAATALVTAVRLGLPAAYFGTLGDDPAGRAILAGLRGDGVDTALVRTIPGRTSHTASILVGADTGSRTVVWDPGTVPPPRPEDLPEAELRRASFLHLDGHHPEAALPLARRARRLGLTVSLDAGSWYPWFDALLPEVDILIGSARFAREFTGETEPAAMAAKLAAAGPGVAGVTLGERGGYIQARGDGFAYPGFPVPVRDTNGAGDVFHGAFLSALALGAPPREAAVFAAAAAALKCTALGGRTGIPSRRAVLAFLAEQGMSIMAGIPPIV